MSMRGERSSKGVAPGCWVVVAVVKVAFQGHPRCPHSSRRIHCPADGPQLQEHALRRHYSPPCPSAYWRQAALSGRCQRCRHHFRSLREAFVHDIRTIRCGDAPRQETAVVSDDHAESDCSQAKRATSLSDRVPLSSQQTTAISRPRSETKGSFLNRSQCRDHALPSLLVFVRHMSLDGFEGKSNRRSAGPEGAPRQRE